MSVDRKDYLMLAVDIKDKHIDFYADENEKFLPYIEGREDIEFAIIDDCMCGNFCFFGKVFKTAEEYDGFDASPLEINDIILEHIKAEIAYEYFKLFGEQLNENDIKLYCFTKYW